MAVKIHLSIPEPCHEDWEKMNPTEQGRFCNACNKCVIDFSLFSDDELLAYFSKAPKNICGRFKNNQLNKTITPTPIYRPWFTYAKKWLVATGLWIGVTAKAFTQTTDSASTQQEISNQYFDIHPTLESTRTLTGMVVDSATNEALPGVMIVVTGTSLGTYTNADGGFSILLPKEYVAQEVSLQLQFIAYENHTFVVKPDENDITLKISSDIILLKEVVVCSKVPGHTEYIVGALPAGHFSDNKIYEPRRTRWQRIKDFFKNLF